MTVFMLKFLLCQKARHLLASILYKVKSDFKILLRPIIWVGHGVVILVVGEIICKTKDFLPVGSIARHTIEVGNILMIHSEDIIEAVEILWLHLSRPAAEVISAAGATFPHPAVGQLPRMPGSYAGGVYFHKTVESGVVSHNTLHHSLGSRRPADIAKTYKQKIFLQRVLSFFSKHNIIYNNVSPASPHSNG